jgi:hypothetical protein
MDHKLSQFIGRLVQYHPVTLNVTAHTILISSTASCIGRNFYLENLHFMAGKLNAGVT